MGAKQRKKREREREKKRERERERESVYVTQRERVTRITIENDNGAQFTETRLGSFEFVRLKFQTFAKETCLRRILHKNFQSTTSHV